MYPDIYPLTTDTAIKSGDWWPIVTKTLLQLHLCLRQIYILQSVVVLKIVKLKQDYLRMYGYLLKAHTIYAICIHCKNSI